MAKLSVKEIKDLARKIVGEHPGGIRYSEIVHRILEQHGETPANTVSTSVLYLDRDFDDVLKPSRGLFTPNIDAIDETQRPQIVTSISPREEFFYDRFAEWLKNDLDEATEAIALGGAGLRNKWGTPDVIGIFKAKASDRFKFDPEIISAEIKTDPRETITAFGQAIAYRLFSHKVYIVLPSTVSEEEQSRIEALSLLFGIGFVQFDLNPEDPQFRAIVRAQRYSPDMFYVNEFADRLHDHRKAEFNQLFQ